MRKYWLIAALLFILVLAGCSGAAKSTAAPMECTVSSVFPEPTDPASIKLPAISDKDWSRGASDAQITFLEYSDFQCPYCSLAGRSLEQFAAAHPDDVQVVYRHFPLPGHDKAVLAAQAAEAAGMQGKFWEMHDFLFNETNWDTWTALSVENFQTWIGEQAAAVGLDADQFTKDMVSMDVVNKVQGAYGSALTIGLNSTPSIYIFIDGKLIFLPEDQIPYDTDTLGILFSLADLDKISYKTCPPMTVNPKKEYTALLKTTKGDITIKLFADKAPLAVNNFVFLAQEGWYDNVAFHRVLPDFVAQAGDPTGTGFGGPGYTFKNEVSDTLKYDRAGLVGMANSGADTNGSQFFITYGPAETLDGGYTIFGEVTSGMDVVKNLTPRDPDASGEQPEPDRILSITIEVK